MKTFKTEQELLKKKDELLMQIEEVEFKLKKIYFQLWKLKDDEKYYLEKFILQNPISKFDLKLKKDKKIALADGNEFKRKIYKTEEQILQKEKVNLEFMLKSVLFKFNYRTIRANKDLLKKKHGINKKKEMKKRERYEHLAYLDKEDKVWEDLHEVKARLKKR